MLFVVYFADEKTTNYLNNNYALIFFWAGKQVV
jgi:hypothetical protein